MKVFAIVLLAVVALSAVNARKCFVVTQPQVTEPTDTTVPSVESTTESPIVVTPTRRPFPSLREIIQFIIDCIRNGKAAQGDIESWADSVIAALKELGLNFDEETVRVLVIQLYNSIADLVAAVRSATVSGSSIAQAAQNWSDALKNLINGLTGNNYDDFKNSPLSEDFFSLVNGISSLLELVQSSPTSADTFLDEQAENFGALIEAFFHAINDYAESFRV